MITQQKMQKLEELSAAIEDKKFIAAEQLRTAQDRFGHVKHKFTREGKEVEITEKVLWQEVYYNVKETTEFMRKQHPEVFKAYDNEKQSVEEMKEFVATEFGVNPFQMSFVDYMKMTELMFDYMIKKHHGELPDNK